MKRQTNWLTGCSLEPQRPAAVSLTKGGPVCWARHLHFCLSLHSSYMSGQKAFLLMHLRLYQQQKLEWLSAYLNSLVPRLLCICMLCMAAFFFSFLRESLGMLLLQYSKWQKLYAMEAITRHTHTSLCLLFLLLVPPLCFFSLLFLTQSPSKLCSLLSNLLLPFPLFLLLTLLKFWMKKEDNRSGRSHSHNTHSWLQIDQSESHIQ